MQRFGNAIFCAWLGAMALVGHSAQASPSATDALASTTQAAANQAAADQVAADQAYERRTGMNPHPVVLQRPAVAPLSAMAELGRAIFFDKTLSGSGQLSCASCHDPNHAYGLPSDASVALGGPTGVSQGARAVPSLMYLERQPPFSIGPDSSADSDTAPVSLTQQAGQATTVARQDKTATAPQQAAQNLVPQGGLFWDGRVNTLQDQAGGPLFNPVEMDAGSVPVVAKKLAQAPYAGAFRQLFGASIFSNDRLLVSEALFAVARYQIEAPSFHPYNSQFDAWLEGKAALSPQAMRGYLAFNDPHKGNCAACHLDQPTADGLPPLFTDHQYEALGVPRNPAIAANADAHYFDLGLCGPFRSDLKSQTQYCGMFVTPSLRNVALRHAFFHNGVYHHLREVLDFYALRDTQPEKIYPVRHGIVQKFNDVPAKYRENVDVVDAPFNRQAGQPPALSAADRQDIIAFLRTLTDGYAPSKAAPPLP